MQTMAGGCHCGRVRFRVTANLDCVIECNCSICAKKGFLHLFVPPGQFELLCGRDDLTTYRFNTGTAQHTFCRHCGIHPFYVPRSDPSTLRDLTNLPTPSTSAQNRPSSMISSSLKCLARSA